MSTKLPSPTEIDLPNNKLTVWTDGSLFSNKQTLAAGAAILHSPQSIHRNDPIAYISTKVSSPYPSSTTCEIAALHIPLQVTPKHIKLVIKTDSLNTIRNMQKITSQTLSAREILKLPDHLYLQINNHYYKQFIHPPVIEKVTAHSNEQWNNEVDLLAKHAATKGSNIHADHIYPHSPTEIAVTAPADLLNLPTFRTTFRNNVPLQKYPAQVIKKDFQNKIQSENNQYLNEKYPTVNINHNLTFNLTNQFPRSNFLDTRFTHELKFRLKLLNKSLSTKHNLHRRRIIPDNICPFCDQIETIEHLWTCHNTTQQLDELYSSFQQNLRSRYKNREGLPIDLSTDPLINRIIQLSGINSNWKSHTNCIITTELSAVIADLPKPHSNIPLVKSSSKLENLLLVLDCWYNALYQIIWIPRNKKFYETIQPNPEPPPDRPQQPFHLTPINPQRSAHRPRLPTIIITPHTNNITNHTTYTVTTRNQP